MNILNAERAEASRVYLLLLTGLFMGFFVSTLSVGAETLFLNNFSEEKDLPLAILASGLFGVVATFIYNYFQSRVSFERLATGTLLVIFCLLLTVTLGYSQFDNPLPLYFLTFTFILPFTYLVLLIFWGAFGRLFDVRQSKRIIGGIDMGQLTASILALLIAIPYLLNTIQVQLQDLLLISVICLGGVLLAFRWLMYNGKKYVNITIENVPVSYKSFFANKYIVLMIGFVIVSMIAVTFIDYSFYSVTTAQFDENTLPLFLTYFNGTVIVFSFLFQTFATDKIIALYGLRVSLLINPLLIIIITGLACLVGASFGFTPDSSTFIFFFVIIAISKLFVSSLKDALDGPAFKLYFLPIDSENRFDIQTKIEGVITAFGSTIAGAIILIFNNIAIFNLLTITIAVIPLLLIWYWVTHRMHGGYKATLQDTLFKNKLKSASEANEFSIQLLLKNQVESASEIKKLYGLKLMEKLEPSLFKQFSNSITGPLTERIKAYINPQREVRTEPDRHTIKKLAAKAFKDNQNQDAVELTFEQMSALSRSMEVEHRLQAAKLFRHHSDAKNIFLLLDLLRDANFDVRMEAIKTAQQIKRPETWNLLIDMLDSNQFGHAAATALVEAGEAVLQTLESAFHKSGQSDKIMMVIIRLMAKIGGPEAEDLLLRKIDFPDKRMVHQVLAGFGYKDYNAQGNQAQIIMNLIDEEMAKTIWNMAAITELPKDEAVYTDLREALKEEVTHNGEQVFMLLSLLYDAQSVSLVKENVQSETSEGIAFGIELLDMFISSELKPKLYPLIDDMPIQEKVRKLHDYFPREEFTPRQLINNILNRDSNQLSRWVKACAIHTLGFMEDYETNYGILAHIFNKDMLLKEVAAWVVYHRDKDRFDQVMERLPISDRQQLIETIKDNKLYDGLDDGYFLLVEIVMFLKQTEVFKDINGSLLCELADNTVVLQLKPDDTVDLRPSENNSIYVVAIGEAEVLRDGVKQERLLTKAIYGELFTPEKKLEDDTIRVVTNSVIFKLNLNNFYMLMSSSHEFTNQLLKAVTNKELENA